eukprot:399901-Pyramimonas_sp.AAC.1
MAATFDFQRFFVVFDVLRPRSGRASRAGASLLALSAPREVPHVPGSFAAFRCLLDLLPHFHVSALQR